MTGIILKDLLVVKKTLQIYFLMLLAGILVSNFMDMSAYILIFTAIAGVLIPLQAMVDDEQNRWNQYVIVLPIERNKIALCKYVVTFSCIILSYIAVYIGSILSGGLQSNLSVEMMLGSMAVSVLYAIIIIPLSFKYGTTKARILIFLICYLPVFLAFIAKQIGISIDFLMLIEKGIYMVPVIYLLLIAISIGISIHICNRKEF